MRSNQKKEKQEGRLTTRTSEPSFSRVSLKPQPSIPLLPLLGDDFTQFRASARASGTNSSRPSDILASLRAKGAAISSDTEKNINRLDLLRNLSRAGPLEKPDLSFALRKVTGRLNPAQEKFIDDYFPNSTSSKATNRLPLPTDDSFAPKSQLHITSGLTMASLESSDVSHSDYLAHMYRHVDRNLAKLAPRTKTGFLDETKQVFWYIKPTGGNRPESREGASLCLVDRKIFLFGGQSMTKKNDVRVLNTDNWTWTLLPAEYPPKGRVGHTTVVYKNQLVLFGGWSHYSTRLRMRRCFKKVYVLYMDQEIRWQRFRGNGKVPKSRRYHSAAILGWSMMIFGGVDTHSKVLKGLSVLEMETLTWVKPHVLSEDKPSARSCSTFTPVFHAALLTRTDFSMFAVPKLRMDQVIANSGIYLFGGIEQTGKVNDELWVMNTHEQAVVWRRVVTDGHQPIARSDHSSVLMNGCLLLFGGRNDGLFSVHGDCCINDISILNIETLTWENVRVLGTVPSARWGHCAVSLGTRMFVFGGINTKEFLPSEVFVLETDIPFVTELAKQEAEKDAAKAARLGRRISVVLNEKYAKA